MAYYDAGYECEARSFSNGKADWLILNAPKGSSVWHFCDSTNITMSAI